MNPGFVNALEMLPVPKTANPAEGRGARDLCVYCGGEPALTVGPRLYVADGALHRWMPRTCKPCARTMAEQTHHAHRGSCARCTEWEHCVDSRALYHLARGQPDGL